MAVNSSILSAGAIIYSILSESEEVMSRVTRIFPVVSEDKATLPYIVYRRTNFDEKPVKSGRGADTCLLEVICYAADYTEGIELAEAVRDALDGVSYDDEENGVRMRSCYLTDSQEDWGNDAYAQQLVFQIKIN